MRADSLHRILLLCLVVGLGFSVYAMFEVIHPALQNSCSINSYVSCGKVDTSQYTNIGPVPDYAIGLGGFLLMLALDIPLLRTFEVRYLYAIIALASVGAIVAVGLGLVEVFLIQAICPICLGAYLSDAAALGVALGIWRMRRRAEREEAAASPAASTG